MVVTQIILLSWWFNKKNLIKKTQSKRPTKTTQSKWSGPNQLIRNGILVKLDMGAKKPYGEFFFTKIPHKKNRNFL